VIYCGRVRVFWVGNHGGTGDSQDAGRGAEPADAGC
jgi:hypothetical protein